MLILSFMIFHIPGYCQTYLEEIQDKWKNSAEYLLDVAESMPDSLYDYRPTEEQMTFGDQLIHISNNMIWLSTDQLGYENEPKPQLPEKSSDPTQVRAYVISAFAFAGRAINNETTASLNKETPFFAGPKTHRQIINLMNDHVTHHRGQLIVYLRLNGIIPRRYVGW